MPEEEPSLNIPSLLTLAVVSFFVIRWFLKRDGSSDGSGSRSRRGNVIDPAQVEQISQMFPQLSTREILWDLQRNRGNAAATTERILSGRGLDTPPPSFQPPIAIPPTAATTVQPSVSAISSKADGQDLISRYNLSSKVSGVPESTAEGPSQKPPSGWSQSKEERQRMLQKRRDDMILAARKKMEQKQQQAKGASS
ncbi:putative AMFR protein [Aspergillus clavatus NRRL 1]|uniref:Coupling of ubiquitin conjugation to ER degradation protein 1 n=1 Tax=Aspergillus clavatus (strain ATCC 1007 / CBS 513.65 / DSM 816 / NCTC 3887 / NRRL 1 / QM 1276 / 107) TaxID=344612 RepID=A1C6F4_ASPCL|nr:AMFR protein, putative [Aspergillus clavatus NRRL 1]EAW13975.1 AMFR protein, putative [Aspergillus clavatus NRRL 1]